MPLKKITWIYVDGEEPHWEGHSDGLVHHVRFYLALSGNKENEYKIWSSIRGYNEECCLGLDQAKDRATDLLNQYYFSLCIP